MNYLIEIQNDMNYPIEESCIRRAAHLVLTIHQVQSGADMSIVITDNNAMRSLNQQFRGIDAVTDVLSFPVEPLPAELLDEFSTLGDLIIAYPYVQQYAQSVKDKVEDHLVGLVVHGMLHLLGYNHDTIDSRTKMWRQQTEILSCLGIPARVVPI